MSATVTPLAGLRVSKYLIPPSTIFPNAGPTGRPLLIYHSAFSLTPAASRNGTFTLESTIRSHLRGIGVVEPQWTYPMYTQHHYHSTTHEVLAVCSGRALLCFGGADHEARVEVQVEKGDVMVVPAGYAHAMLQDLRDGSEHEGVAERFKMVGSYPIGAEQWDHQTGPARQEAEEKMKGLKWFERDPIYGDRGPVLDV